MKSWLQSHNLKSINAFNQTAPGGEGGGGDSTVFQLRFLTHSACKCDVTQQRVRASGRLCKLHRSATPRNPRKFGYENASLLYTFVLADRQTPLSVNNPANENSPNWFLYRLTVDRMKSLREVSTHWRATCGYDKFGINN